MNAISQINQRVQKLPLALQEDVLQFIDYLLFKHKSVQPANIASEAKPFAPPPAYFAWAGALKGVDESLSSVEWQHKISDMMIADFTPSTFQ